MRIHLASLAALALVGAGLASVPASAAALSPVGKITVTPSTDRDGTAVVDVSWASVPADADGALVCMHRGTKEIAKPRDCESQIGVAAPKLSSGPITMHPGKNYVVEVFAYQRTSPITYSAPVSKVRHGIKIAMSSSCGDQTAGSTCKITGKVTDAMTGRHPADRKLELWMSKEKQPAHWFAVGSKKTNRHGVARIRITLDRTRLYQWHYASPRTRELSSSSARLDLVVS